MVEIAAAKLQGCVRILSGHQINTNFGRFQFPADSIDLSGTESSLRQLTFMLEQRKFQVFRSDINSKTC